MINGFLGKVISKGGKKVEVEIEGQRISLSKEHFSSSIKEGDQFRLYFLKPEESVIHQKKMAKYILEEILNGK